MEPLENVCENYDLSPPANGRGRNVQFSTRYIELVSKFGETAQDSPFVRNVERILNAPPYRANEIGDLSSSVNGYASVKGMVFNIRYDNTVELPSWFRQIHGMHPMTGEMVPYYRTYIEDIFREEESPFFMAEATPVLESIPWWTYLTPEVYNLIKQKDGREEKPRNYYAVYYILSEELSPDSKGDFVPGSPPFKAEEEDEYLAAKRSEEYQKRLESGEIIAEVKGYKCVKLRDGTETFFALNEVLENYEYFLETSYYDLRASYTGIWWDLDFVFFNGFAVHRRKI